MSENPIRRWWRVRNNLTKTIYYARKGFGEDGSVVAVCETRDPYCTGWRFTAEHMRKNYTLLEVLEKEKSDKFEERFQYELHR